jgi:hypothetical protein
MVHDFTPRSRGSGMDDPGIRAEGPLPAGSLGCLLPVRGSRPDRWTRGAFPFGGPSSRGCQSRRTPIRNGSGADVRQLPSRTCRRWRGSKRRSGSAGLRRRPVRTSPRG